MPSKTSDRIRKALLDGDALSDVQKRVVLDYQRSVGGELGEVVVRLGFMTDEEVKALVEGETRLSVTKEMVAQGFVEKVPAQLLRGYRVIPVTHGGGTVLAAEEAGIEPIVLEEIWNLLGLQLSVVQAKPGTVMAALEDLDPKRDAPARAAEALPEISVGALDHILLEKGIISVEDVRACAEGVRDSARRPVR